MLKMSLRTLLLRSVTLLLMFSVATSSKKEKQSLERRNRGRSSRNLVPQLLPNYTAPSLPPAHEVGCGQATLACAYRGGCGLALQQYMLSCSHLVHGHTDKCDRNCRHSLIALISTVEGKRLMECSCEDSSCEIQKSRVEPCREEVTWNTRPDTVVSCSAATWICGADPLCSTALDYYNRFCKSMFSGRKCSKRCKNSLSILLKQESAGKLATCYCDGTEDFPCQQIRDNTDTLCFGKVKNKPKEVEETNEIDTGGGTRSSGAGHATRWDTLVAIVSLLVTWIVTDMGHSVRTSLAPTVAQRR